MHCLRRIGIFHIMLQVDNKIPNSYNHSTFDHICLLWYFFMALADSLEVKVSICTFST